MSFYDETSQAVFFTSQVLNTSQTSSESIPAVISQITNPIVKNLEEYNVYLVSLSVSTDDVGYLNIYRNIAWDLANFATNKTNLSLSFLSSSGTPFNLNGNTNQLLKGIGNTDGSGNYQGVCCFLQYVSQNGLYANPNAQGSGANSQNYPSSYFIIHSITQFIMMYNAAINTMIGVWTGAPIMANSMYFQYSPSSNLYTLTMPDAFRNSTVDLYANTFAERYLDAFNWSFAEHTNVTSPSFTGLDYKFVKANYPSNKNGDLWTFTTEYSCVANLLDIHSILVVSNQGQLSQITQQTVPVQTFGNSNNLNQPTLSTLKNLDIQFDSLSAASVNNSIIQYTANGMFFPINTTANQALNNINIQLFVQTFDNVIAPLYLPVNGFCNVKFGLVKKRKL